MIEKKSQEGNYKSPANIFQHHLISSHRLPSSTSLYTRIPPLTCTWSGQTARLSCTHAQIFRGVHSALGRRALYPPRLLYKSILTTTRACENRARSALSMRKAAASPLHARVFVVAYLCEIMRAFALAPFLFLRFSL